MIDEKSREAIEKKRNEIYQMAKSDSHRHEFEHALYNVDFVIGHFDKYQRMGDLHQRELAIFEMGSIKAKITEIIICRFNNGMNIYDLNRLVRFYNYLVRLIDPENYIDYRAIEWH